MISELSLNVVRHLTCFLYILRVTPFQWDSENGKYQFYPNRVWFSYVHLLFPIIHLGLSFAFLLGCGVKPSSNQACKNQANITSSLFTATFMTFALICHATLLLSGIDQVAAAHNMFEKFVDRIKREVFLL